MGAWPGPTTNGLSHDGAKLLLPKERLEMFNAIIGAVIDSARQTEQEPVMVRTAVNVHKNDGNLNIPEAEASELAATIAELETTLETQRGGGATLETGAAWFSAQSVGQVGRECWSAWATATAIWFESEFDAPDEAVVIATEFPDDGGVEVETIGNKSADKLLNVDRGVVVLQTWK